LNALEWEPSLDRARQRAHHEGKALLIEINLAPAATSAPPTPAYADDRVARFIREHLVPVKVVVWSRPKAPALYAMDGAPAIVVGGADGGTHYRIQRNLLPDDFLAELRLGLGRYRLDHHEPAEAIRHFEPVTIQQAGTRTAAQALFWLVMAQHKQAAIESCSIGNTTFNRGPTPPARPDH
jgi:hypothetical protein